MRIEQFDPKAEAELLHACFDMTSAGWQIDHPNVPPWPIESFTAKWTVGFDACPQQTWIAVGDSDDSLGAYLLRLPDKENTTRADCTLVVAPARRRAGVGTALLTHCVEQARQVGRDRLASTVRDGSAGERFATAAGAKGGIAEVDRVLVIDAALPGRLATLRAEAEPHSAGYSLVSWLGPCPDEHVKQLVRMHNAMADAPRDEGVEAAVWDAERVRTAEQTAAEHGLLYHTVAARHDVTGDIAGITQLCTEAGTPGWGFQLMTAVLPSHRGHRLGMLVKVAMLDWLAEVTPEVRRVYTGNAGTNEHMVAINARLGFEVKDVYRSWELDLNANAITASS